MIPKISLHTRKMIILYGHIAKKTSPKIYFILSILNYNSYFAIRFLEFLTLFLNDSTKNFSSCQSLTESGSRSIIKTSVRTSNLTSNLE